MGMLACVAAGVFAAGIFGLVVFLVGNPMLIILAPPAAFALGSLCTAMWASQGRT